MAYTNDQEENTLPIGNGESTSRKSSSLLPKYFRTPTNTKFLYSTLDQLLNPGTVEKISAYYGRKTAKAFLPNDNYISEVSNDRENYQLEPVVVRRDNLNNVLFHKDYVDYINQIKSLSGNADNHSVLNSQEYYSWNSNIDWDKFVNFREYYWLTYGPDPITITGLQQQVQSTYTVTLSDNQDNVAYLLTPDGQTVNATITLYRGITYRFDINTPGLPFTIKTARTLDEDFLYAESPNGISAQNIELGIMTFVVDQNTPDTLYYVAANDINAYGLIQVADIEDNSEIDVTKEILGKKDYKLNNGIDLSNGMKVNFKGNVIPSRYATNDYYVEGVGESIQLINEQDLAVPNAIADENLETFDDAEGFDKATYDIDDAAADIKDYIVIKKNSLDRNPWSRANKWIHKSVLQAVATYNGVQLDVDETLRAKRPIIEFDAGLKLQNFGTYAKQYVDVVDTFTTDVFSTIEGATGYNVDGVDLVNGMRILVTADTDILVKNRIFQVNIINFGGDGDPTNKQIALTEPTDSLPLENEVVLVLNGQINQGKMYYYDGASWLQAQEKSSANVAPLFDLCDSAGISFNDQQKYFSSNFQGNKIFSYKTGVGTNDTELGFPLSYRNVNNVGDILFDFNLLADTFNYQLGDTLISVSTDVGYLKKYSSRTVKQYTHGWIKAAQNSKQMILRQYLGSEQINKFAVDQYKKSATLMDLELQVYVDNKLLQKNQYTTTSKNDILYVQLIKDLELNQSIILKTHSVADKTAVGYYEMAINMQNNPLNENINNFTFGQVSNHVESIIDQLSGFVGNNPGSNNLRDLGNIAPYGTKFVQHSAPINLALYHLTEKKANIIKAVSFAGKEYDKFKKIFLQTAENSGFDGSVREHVDKIMQTINKDKNSKMPFYFSDMVPYGAAKKLSFKVYDDSNIYFALSKNFDMSKLSVQSVQVYLNNQQLFHNTDYTFSNEGFCIISTPLAVNDSVEIYEYESTIGNYVPPTPTKLGIYPKYKPVIYQDTTLVDPVAVLQGHDGSIMVAYGDYRDDLLLELEKRIYNNIKVQYDRNIRNIHDFLPGTYRNTDHKTKNIDQSFIDDFIRWNALTGAGDYTEHYFYDSLNDFTYNHSHMLDPMQNPLPGFWRAIYKQTYDTDRPHTHPWEMLGYSEQPVWWNTVYGPGPYTSDNLILWEDLRDGIIREPGKKLVYDSRYKRTNLLDHLPVDEDGALLSPMESNYAKNFILDLSNKSFIFGDYAPVETAWRRSSNYPFSLIKAMLLNKPAHTMAVNFDVSRVVKSITDELIYSDTEKRISLRDLKFPNSLADEDIILTSGLVNYVANYINTDVLSNYEEYKNALTNLTQQLGFKIKGFSEKEKFKLLLDSRSPLSQGNVFVPDENYDLYLNVSTPITVLVYSGVIIEKLAKGFVIKGYDSNFPKFKYFEPIKKQDDQVKKIGAVSSQFVLWTAKKRYAATQIVSFRNQYYSAKFDHISGANFDVKKYIKLAELPTDGGVVATFSKNFSTEINLLDYGTVLKTQQEVVDFILGYGKYLEAQGFIFDSFNQDINTIENWILSAQEFMFWTTQNWRAGAVLALSPSANKLQLKTTYSVADNVFDNFYDYAVLRADGVKILKQRLSVVRQANDFTLSTKNTNEGIYFAKIPLIQKEHAVLIDNVTVFNDVIYDLAPGYRQERIKVIGYVVSNWNGSLDVPGFIYDEVIIKDWQTYTDYKMSDVVKYKEFFYSATVNVKGSDQFENQYWKKLDKRPTSVLRPNFDYKTNQFGDFYDLDTDNFDPDQQRLAQHIIGYQKRQYLQNIINDDVAQYKFYQGFIQEKGTKGALSKLFDALASANNDSIEFYEEWAIRIGQYGATTAFDEVEYLLDEKKFKINPQPILLTDDADPSIPDYVLRIKNDETYLKYQNYQHTPFPLKLNTKEYVKTAGYVDPNDVDYQLKTFNDILTIDTSNLKFDQYFWIGFFRQSFDIFKHVKTSYKVLSVTETNNLVTVTLDQPADLALEDIISVIIPSQNSKQLFKIKSVSLDKITCEKNGDTVKTDNDGSSFGFLGKFVSHKLANLQAINNKASESQGFKDNNLFWIDDNNLSAWAVLKNKKAFGKHQQVTNWNVNSNGSYGQNIAVDASNNLLVVPDLNIGLYVYRRGYDGGQFTLRQIIDVPQDIWTGTADFGASLDISPDGKYLVVGAPKASLVKTYYKGAFSAASAYAVGDIVQHKEQLWKVVNPVLGQDPSVDFTTFSATSFWSEAEYDAGTGTYPVIKQLITGNYAFANVGTDHILIRATTDQYRGSAVGDTLVLYWNNLTTEYPLGNNPFNGLAVGINKTFIDGSHVIQEKIDQIINVDLTIIAPVVGDTLNTDTATGEVSYIFTQGTQSIIYLSNVQGNFLDTAQIRIGPIPVGDYTRVITEDYDSVAGWWKIDVPSPGTTSGLADTKRSLVVRDIIKAGDPRTAFLYFNSLDTKAAQDILLLPVNSTPASQLSVLSYFKTDTIPGYSTYIGAIQDDRFMIRAPKLMSDVFPTFTYDEVGIWFNTILTGTPATVIEPTALDLPFEDLNGVKEIVDVWNGFINVNVVPDGLGTFYVPSIGDTVEDAVTLSQAEVAYVKVIGFNLVQIYIKNKTGAFNITNSLTLIGSPNRTVGIMQVVQLENAVSGSLFVFDAGFTIVPTTNSVYHFINNLEYYLYQDITQDGVSRSASVPSRTNRDFTQTFNIPAGAGYVSNLNQQGVFMVYERQNNNSYTLYKSFIIPEAYPFASSANNLKLGTNIKLRQKNNVTTLYVTTAASDNGNLAGKLYFIKKTASEDWIMKVDPFYTGLFDSTQSYITDDLVAYNDVIYRSLTSQAPGSFNSIFWTALLDGAEYLGYVPSPVSILGGSPAGVPTLEGDSTVNIEGFTEFASSFDVNHSGSMIAVAVKDMVASTEIKKVVIYRLNSDRYQFSQTLIAPNNNEDNTEFASIVAVSDDGMFVAVGSPKADLAASDGGVVYVYKQNSGVFALAQTLVSPQAQGTEKFGNNLDFDGNTLAVSSLNGDTELNFSLDGGVTFFDSGATTFNTKIYNTGSIYLYENYNDVLIYADEFSVSNENLTEFGKKIKVLKNHVYASMPHYVNDLASPNTEGLIIDFRKNSGSNTWFTHKSPMYPVDLEKIKAIYLYDTVKKKLITRLDYIDAVQGKIAGPAEQELYYKTPYDPAIYTNGSSLTTVDVKTHWNKAHVGRLWWDLSTVKFYNAYQGNIIFAKNYWNKIFPGSSIDVYEWVESTFAPQEWNTLVDNNNPAAVLAGISGRAKSVDSYVLTQTYDFISNSFIPKYYFWVKNKTTLPAVDSRKISALDVAQLIEDPNKQFYKFVSLISDNKLSLHNITNVLENDSIAINISFYNISNTELNIHNQYQLLSDGVPYSRPNKEIEAVWFNSLIGYDEQFRSVPDPQLSNKYRYGTLKKPRQGWYINRIEALKQTIERVNAVCRTNLIRFNKDISRLTESEKIPSTISRLYDLARDSYADLAFVGTANVIPADLRPIVVNGKIIDVTIVNPGSGYRVTPTFNIVDTNKFGSGADISITINLSGQINSVTVNRQGSNYSSNTRIVVRRFSVLIRSDANINNKWAVYSWDSQSKEWNRILLQSYDVNLFWRYIDWYAAGYDAFTDINAKVSDSYKLQLLDDNIGDIVKIENIGTGGWILLEKIDNQVNVDYTINYKTVGRQDGTVEFKKTLYDFIGSTVGFNSTSFDLNRYDYLPITELRIILETIRDKIFTNELDIEYNQLFFANLRYVHSEQSLVDWAFKTSFVKGKHNVGELAQKVVYKNDNLDNYQDYINEVKPYKSKVREYISAYESVDETPLNVTDFDLPATYNSESKQIEVSVAKYVNNQIVGSNLTSAYPNKHYLDNLGFKVIAVKIADAGRGYLGVPVVKILGTGGVNQTFIITSAPNPSTPPPNNIYKVDGTDRPVLTLIRGGVYTFDQSAVSNTNHPLAFKKSDGIAFITGVVSTGIPGQLGAQTVFTVPNDAPDSLRYYCTVHGNGMGNTISVINASGTGATAKAFVTNGRLSRIEITNQGTGYLSAPIISIQGTLDANGYAAKAVSILGNSLIKSTHIRVKFDRTTGSLLITDFARTENFVGSGNQLRYTLKWPINLKSNKITVIVNQRRALYSEYVYNNLEDTSKSYVRSKGFVLFNQPPTIGSTIQIQYEIDANVLQTQDRVNLLYEPTTGQLGQELSQLIDGIDYGGVEVRSIDFGGGTGWDADPYFSGTWDTYDTTFEDEVFRLDGSTNTFVLSQPLAAAVHYNIYKNGVRIDDPNYGTGQPVANPNALMQTIIGDGSTTVVQINEQIIPTVANDLIVIRKSTSDGSFIPDPDAYDTLLSGGDLTYNTAAGILAQDIIIDGDGFVTPITSKGPEELVPGHILDTVDIQVYDRSSETGSRINSYNYKGNGSATTFAIDSLPQSQEAVFVKVNNVIINDTQYTVDYPSKNLIFNSAPSNNSQINIITMSINGERIVDVDQFIGDGSTFIFVTRAKFNISQNAYVKVNGQTASFVLGETDSGYQFQDMTLLRFAVPPAAGSVITYVIYASTNKTFSEVTYDNFTGDGSSVVYTLGIAPFNQQPLTHNVIVKVGNSILNAGYNERFNVTAVRQYALKPWQQPFTTVLRTDVRAFLNGVELTSTQYRWESANSQVVLETGIGTVGDILKVYVISDGDYTVVGNTLTLDTAPTVGTNIKVWQFSNHDIEQIERINYDVVDRTTVTVGTDDYFEYQNLTNGLIRLRESAIDAQYVWVSVNGVTLTPSVDYKLSNDQQFLKIRTALQQNDVIDIVHFTAAKYTAKFGFRQFKDMLNRTHYKRLGNDYKYFLTQPLYWYNQEIYLTDTTGLTVPNPSLGRPGVIFIDGERIEYFLKYENRVGQLRRGTLGTGVKSMYTVGTEVFDQSSFQNVPYTDEYVTEVFTSDGSTENITLSWIPLSANEFEVFVAGKRLRKNSISRYNPTLGMDSPEADVTMPAEFSVTGTSTTLALLVAPPINTKITVVRRLGRLWNANTALSQTENDIARFLRAKEVSLPQ